MGLIITPSKLELPAHLALYASVELAHARSGEDQFSIVAGLSKALVEDLRRHSLDESDTELMQGTSDHRRFGTGAYEDWFAKERYAFALTQGGKLAALIWFGPEELPEEFSADGGPVGKNDTLAFRSYEPYRGKGLMTDFSRFVLETYARMFPARKLWLQTNADNAAALRLYQKLGFELKGPRSDNGRLVMVQP